MSDSFDREAYCARLGLTAIPSATLEGLRELHLAHALSIPFENLDIQLGRRIALDLESLQDKLVRRRRGGYCFEQSTLLQHALRASGFDPVACGARVRVGSDRVLPRTHMVLVVAVGGAELLADVGFGGIGPLEPVPMDGRPHAQHGFVYRVAEEGPLHVMQRESEDGWQDLYAFDRAAFLPADVEVANWFTSTYPESRFVVTLTAQRPSLAERHVLRDLEHTVVRPGRPAQSTTIARAELVPLLREVFGIEVPPDARFLALDSRPTEDR